MWERVRVRVGTVCILCSSSLPSLSLLSFRTHPREASHSALARINMGENDLTTFHWALWRLQRGVTGWGSAVNPVCFYYVPPHYYGTQTEHVPTFVVGTGNSKDCGGGEELGLEGHSQEKSSIHFECMGKYAEDWRQGKEYNATRLVLRMLSISWERSS